MIKKIIYVFVVVAIISGIFGAIMMCNILETTPANTTKEETVLTDRQKDILKEKGLPTDFNELTYSQQNAIIEIEEMLSYLEDKYDTEFLYGGYTPKQYMDEKTLYAYPKGGDSYFDIITVTEGEDGYEDTYMEMMIEDSYSEYIYSYLKELRPETEMRVYADVGETTLEEIPEDYTEFDGRVGSFTLVYLDSTNFNESELEGFKEEVHALMEEHGIYGRIRIILMREDKIQFLTKYNNTDYISSEHYIEDISTYLNGELKE